MLMPTFDSCGAFGLSATYVSTKEDIRQQSRALHYVTLYGFLADVQPTRHLFLRELIHSPQPHDFAAFRSVGTETPDSVRTLKESTVVVDEERVIYRVTGTGFLRYMVRTIVGTLVEIGRGWRPVGDMATLLQHGGRSGAGATAPPHGLFLVRVDYD